MPEFEGKWKPTDFFFVVSQFEINAEGVWLISAQRLERRDNPGGW
jgi:hypothetical protein